MCNERISIAIKNYRKYFANFIGLGPDMYTKAMHFVKRYACYAKTPEFCYANG